MRKTILYFLAFGLALGSVALVTQNKARALTLPQFVELLIAADTIPEGQHDLARQAVQDLEAGNPSNTPLAQNIAEQMAIVRNLLKAELTGSGRAGGSLSASQYDELIDRINIERRNLQSYVEHNNDPITSLSGTAITGSSLTNPTITGGSANLDMLTVDGNTLYVDAVNGRVGIGTDSPQVPLHVKNGYIWVEDAESGSGILRVGAAYGKPAIVGLGPDGTTGIGGKGLEIDAAIDTSNLSTGQAIKFRTISYQDGVRNGSWRPRLIIFADGRIGIGTEMTSASALLHVQSSTIGPSTGIGVPTLVAQSVTGQTADILQVQNGSATNLMVVNATGNLGIGTTTPFAKLSVKGTAAFDGLSTAAGTPSALCLTSGGEMVVNTGTSDCTVSSRQFKHDIAGLAASEASRIVSALRPVSFAYNDSDQAHVGFIAEEVELIDPRLVAHGEDGSPRSVHYAELTSVLTAVVQAQQAQLDVLLADTVMDDNHNLSTSFASLVRNTVMAVLESIDSLFVRKIVVENIQADKVSAGEGEFSGAVSAESLCLGSRCVSEEQLADVLDLLERENGISTFSTSSITTTTQTNANADIETPETSEGVSEAEADTPEPPLATTTPVIASDESAESEPQP